MTPWSVSATPGAPWFGGLLAEVVDATSPVQQ
jgi:hypothetical protein